MTPDLTLPRAAWADHPRFPTQVLLLGSHENFRHVSRVLCDRAAAGGDRAGIVEVFGWWKAGMRSHERYEEGKLYPYLVHRFGISIAAMEVGHDELAVEDQRVRAAVDSDPLALAAALQRHDEVLLAHLDLEERTVIPALLALEPHEFQEYCDHGLSWLTARHRAA